MLKLFFWVLLLANGALLVYQQGYLDSWRAASREPDRLVRQINADKIKLMPVGANGGNKDSSNNGGVAKPADAATASGDDAALISAAVAQADAKPEFSGCTEIGNFSEADARRFDAQIAALALGNRLTRRTVSDNISHIVYMPPQGSKENADRKIAELRRLGVSDFFVIQDNPALRWGISLGIFSTEEAAKARLAEVTRQGVRSARVGVRNGAGKVAFQLHQLDAGDRTKLEKIKQAYPQQQERSCV